MAYNVSVNNSIFKYKVRININLENCFVGGVPFMMEKKTETERFKDLNPYNFEVNLLRIVIAPFLTPEMHKNL